MKIAKSNSGLVVGAIFTGCSLLLTATFFVPIISVLPGIIFETIAKSMVTNEPYNNVGKTTILLLSIVFLVTLILCLTWIRQTVVKEGQVSRGSIIVIMLIMYSIIHSLGFYIYWGLALDFRSDGQLIFSAVVSFPISSFAFVFIGILIDKIKNKGWTNVIMNNP